MIRKLPSYTNHYRIIIVGTNDCVM